MPLRAQNIRSLVAQDQSNCNAESTALTYQNRPDTVELLPARHSEITAASWGVALTLDVCIAVLNPAISCSILVSTSLIFSSCRLLSSRIRPFSKFRSNLTPACVRVISSRSRCFSFSISDISRSFSALSMAKSFFSINCISDLI
jgi:hypothetical protein